MEVTHNVVGWFEIPAIDIERAMKFYKDVFGFELTRQQMGDLDMAFFPYHESNIGSGGALVCNPEWYQPNTNGIVVYLTAFSGDLANEMAKVESAGGKVIMEKTLITPEIGYMGMFIDSEGNRMAMHSRA